MKTATLGCSRWNKVFAFLNSPSVRVTRARTVSAGGVRGMILCLGNSETLDRNLCSVSMFLRVECSEKLQVPGYLCPKAVLRVAITGMKSTYKVTPHFQNRGTKERPIGFRATLKITMAFNCSLFWKNEIYVFRKRSCRLHWHHWTSWRLLLNPATTRHPIGPLRATPKIGRVCPLSNGECKNAFPETRINLLKLA